MLDIADGCSHALHTGIQTFVAGGRPLMDPARVPAIPVTSDMNVFSARTRIWAMPDHLEILPQNAAGANAVENSGTRQSAIYPEIGRFAKVMLQKEQQHYRLR